MISNYLKEYFRKRKITHEEIERKTGVARSKITMSFNGKRKLTAEELILISIKFDLDLNKIKKSINN